MNTPADINRPIIESLYCEALVLADEVRARFDLSSEDRIAPGEPYEGVSGTSATIVRVPLSDSAAERSLWQDAWAQEQCEPDTETELNHQCAYASPETVRAARSSEGLKTTTRMMYMLAWLLNYRAYFGGQLTLPELRQRGHLPADRPSDTTNLALLDSKTRQLIESSHTLYARVTRLDAAWHQRFSKGADQLVH